LKSRPRSTPKPSRHETALPFLWTYLANELVLGATRPEHVLVLSPFIVLELGRVLHYERLLPIHGLDEQGIQQYLADLMLAAEMVVPPARLATAVATDPDGDPILATAVAGRVDILSTRDRHFFQPEVLAWCAAHRIEVVGDVELLARLKAI